MKTQEKKKFKISRMNVLTWLGRTLSLVLGFILILFVINDFQTTHLAKLHTPDWVLSIFFPIGALIGFAMSWKNEMLGSIISIVGMLCFFGANYFLNDSLPKVAQIVFFNLPAYIFFISSFLNSREKEGHYIHNIRK